MSHSKSKEISRKAALAKLGLASAVLASASIVSVRSADAVNIGDTSLGTSQAEITTLQCTKTTKTAVTLKKTRLLCGSTSTMFC